MINDIALLIPFILFLWGIKIKIGGGTEKTIFRCIVVYQFEVFSLY